MTMKKEQKGTTEDQLKDVLKKEASRFSGKSTGLTDIFKKFAESGLLEKSEYTFPLADTIGRNIYEQNKFSSPRS